MSAALLEVRDVTAGYGNIPVLREVSLEVRKGDVLRTTCTYANPTSDLVTFGEKTEDEMCFDFLAVYPAPGLVNATGRSTRRCIDPAR